MTDFIFVATNPLEWHRQNRKLNPHHYIRHVRWDSILQSMGAAIYYNVDVQLLPCGKVNLILFNSFIFQRVKYGLISMTEFLNDLCHWKYLYIAGRLHKPVLNLVKPDSTVFEAINCNREHALNVAMLSLPSKFSELDLLHKIVGISYWGDLRMRIAEDPRKICRIVRGQEPQLWEIYGEGLRLKAQNLGNGRYVQDDSAHSKLLQLTKLPTLLYITLRRKYDLFDLVKRPERIPEAIHTAVSSVGLRPSIMQPIKGILTTGSTKSILYTFQKIKKRFRFYPSAF